MSKFDAMSEAATNQIFRLMERGLTRMVEADDGKLIVQRFAPGWRQLQECEVVGDNLVPIGFEWNGE